MSAYTLNTWLDRKWLNVQEARFQQALLDLRKMFSTQLITEASTHIFRPYSENNMYFILDVDLTLLAMPGAPDLRVPMHHVPSIELLEVLLDLRIKEMQDMFPNWRADTTNSTLLLYAKDNNIDYFGLVFSIPKSGV